MCAPDPPLGRTRCLRARFDLTKTYLYRRQHCEREDGDKTRLETLDHSYI